MPKSGANPKRIRPNDERRQWAAAVVKKATPKIVRSLTEASSSLGEPADSSKAQAPPSEATVRATEEHQDESLAALLLRLLRTGGNGGAENVSANAAPAISENSSVG